MICLLLLKKYKIVQILQLNQKYPDLGFFRYDARMITMSYDLRYDRLQKALIEARQSANLTQAEVSVRLNKPQSFVSKYESGERRLDIIELLEICSILSVDIHVIIERIK